jgi:hypothetical protein
MSGQQSLAIASPTLCKLNTTLNYAQDGICMPILARKVLIRASASAITTVHLVVNNRCNVLIAHTICWLCMLSSLLVAQMRYDFKLGSASFITLLLGVPLFTPLV